MQEIIAEDQNLGLSWWLGVCLSWVALLMDGRRRFVSLKDKKCLWTIPNLFLATDGVGIWRQFQKRHSAIERKTGARGLHQSSKKPCQTLAFEGPLKMWNCPITKEAVDERKPILETARGDYKTTRWKSCSVRQTSPTIQKNCQRLFLVAFNVGV